MSVDPEVVAFIAGVQQLPEEFQVVLFQMLERQRQADPESGPDPQSSSKPKPQPKQKAAAKTKAPSTPKPKAPPKPKRPVKPKASPRIPARPTANRGVTPESPTLQSRVLLEDSTPVLGSRQVPVSGAAQNMLYHTPSALFHVPRSQAEVPAALPSQSPFSTSTAHPYMLYDSGQPINTHLLPPAAPYSGPGHMHLQNSTGPPNGQSFEMQPAMTQNLGENVSGLQGAYIPDRRPSEVVMREPVQNGEGFIPSVLMRTLPEGISSGRPRNPAQQQSQPNILHHPRPATYDETWLDSTAGVSNGYASGMRYATFPPVQQPEASSSRVAQPQSFPQGAPYNTLNATYPSPGLNYSMQYTPDPNQYLSAAPIMPTSYDTPSTNHMLFAPTPNMSFISVTGEEPSRSVSRYTQDSRESQNSTALVTPELANCNNGVPVPVFYSPRSSSSFAGGQVAQQECGPQYWVVPRTSQEQMARRL